MVGAVVWKSTKCSWLRAGNRLHSALCQNMSRIRRAANCHLPMMNATYRSPAWPSLASRVTQVVLCGMRKGCACEVLRWSGTMRNIFTSLTLSEAVLERPRCKGVGKWRLEGTTQQGAALVGNKLSKAGTTLTLNQVEHHGPIDHNPNPKPSSRPYQSLGTHRYWLESYRLPE